MQLKDKINELKEIDDAVNDITKDLIMKPGSIFRVACQYLENWGVRWTSDNVKWMKERALNSYMEEYGGTGEEINAAIKRAIVATGLATRPDEEEGDVLLNRNLAGMAINNLMELRKGKKRLRICDVGAGDGTTTVAILDGLARTEEGKELGEICEFHLLEPSFKRIKVAVEQRLELLPIKTKYAIHTETHEEFVPMCKEGTFDMVVSSAVYHHMVFPDYLQDLYDILTPDGVILIGDWHYNFFEHPARVVPLLEDLGLNTSDVNRFKKQFNIPSTFNIRDIDRGLTPDQERTNRKFRVYTIALAQELRKIRKTQYFIEGYELVSERMEKMKQAGFETDIDELRKNHRAFKRTISNVRKIFPTIGDIACVISAGKKQIEVKKKARR